MKRFSVIALRFVLPVWCMLAAACCREAAGGQQLRIADPEGWAVDVVAPGCTWYNYTGYYAPTAACQTINVLEIALADRRFELSVVHSESADSLSAFVQRAGAFAGINGTYFEPEVSFVRTDGRLWREVTVDPSHLRYWKHEGALFLDPAARKAGIAYGDNASYAASSWPVVLSGAPVLIDDGRPVGETFAAVADSVDLRQFDGEDFRRHQGVRHPRTAVALTADNRMLLVTVDGRRQVSAGMTAAELTRMLARHFAPRYALNLDGGGSTTMVIGSRGLCDTHVVNFPTDNKRFDRYGQRPVNNVILINQRK